MEFLGKIHEGFKGKPRRLTVYRKDNGKWIKKSFLFDGGVGGFTYGYGVIPVADYDAMKRYPVITNFAVDSTPGLWYATQQKGKVCLDVEI